MALQISASEQLEMTREAFELEMRKLGMFEQVNGECPMEQSQETGGYTNQDTNAMWAGFAIAWKLLSYGDRDAITKQRDELLAAIDKISLIASDSPMTHNMMLIYQYSNDAISKDKGGAA